MATLKAIHSRDPALVCLLEVEKLPTQDLSGDSKKYFGLHDEEGDLIAVGGLEICGPNAILRSCVVISSQKGRGIGFRLIGELLDTAKEMRLRKIFLLTETADGFFEKFGFCRISRDTVPVEIGASAQFAEICPQSAVAMSLSLVACPN